MFGSFPKISQLSNIQNMYPHDAKITRIRVNITLKQWIKKKSNLCFHSSRTSFFISITGSIFPSASSYWTNPGANLYSNIAAASASHSMGHHHHPGASTAVSHHTGVSPHLASYSHYASPWPAADVHWAAARSLSAGGSTAVRPPPTPYKPIEWTWAPIPGTADNFYLYTEYTDDNIIFKKKKNQQLLLFIYYKLVIAHTIL